MTRLMVVARLRERAHGAAERILRDGPPFDAEALGLDRHGAFLTSTEVVFTFEAPDVEWIVNDLVNDADMSKAFAAWEPLIDGTPRLAHERFYWGREQSRLGIGLGA